MLHQKPRKSKIFLGSAVQTDLITNGLIGMGVCAIPEGDIVPATTYSSSQVVITSGETVHANTNQMGVSVTVSALLSSIQMLEQGYSQQVQRT